MQSDISLLPSSLFTKKAPCDLFPQTLGSRQQDYFSLFVRRNQDSFLVSALFKGSISGLTGQLFQFCSYCITFGMLVSV